MTGFYIYYLTAFNLTISDQLFAVISSKLLKSFLMDFTYPITWKTVCFKFYCSADITSVLCTKTLRIS